MIKAVCDAYVATSWLESCTVVARGGRRGTHRGRATMNGRVAASFLLSLLVASTAYALPNEVAQEGFVTDDDGRPFDGEYDVRIVVDWA